MIMLVALFSATAFAQDTVAVASQEQATTQNAADKAVAGGKSLADQANAAYQRDDFNSALSLYEQAAKEDGTSSLLYYNMGNYMGNNYLSCVITAQNALKEYPYTNLREELSILILKAKFEMAINSIEEKRLERYRETVDEYYAFKNEFPESKHLKEAERIFAESQKVLK